MSICISIYTHHAIVYLGTNLMATIENLETNMRVLKLEQRVKILEFLLLKALNASTLNTDTCRNLYEDIINDDEDLPEAEFDEIESHYDSLESQVKSS